MKATVISIVIAFIMIAGVLVFRGGPLEKQETFIDNVTTIGGTQFIDLTAKGGYTPRKSSAKAGIQTILRVNTDGTFDCSSSIRIPSMSVSENLPQSGVTEIVLGKPSVGVLSGTCGMGMYPFEINFQN